MTHDEATRLADLAREAKSDAVSLGTILDPSSEAARLADFASRARIRLQYNGYWTLADSI